MTSITFYDLMAEPLEIWLLKNKDFGYALEMDDENGDELLRVKCIHPDAIDSFAYFCRSFLNDYDRINDREAA